LHPKLVWHLGIGEEPGRLATNAPLKILIERQHSWIGHCRIDSIQLALAGRAETQVWPRPEQRSAALRIGAPVEQLHPVTYALRHRDEIPDLAHVPTLPKANSAQTWSLVRHHPPA
jgi:hypothetical protein